MDLRPPEDFVKGPYTAGGNSIGRVGTIMHRERHPGSFEIVHIKENTLVNGMAL